MSAKQTRKARAKPARREAKKPIKRKRPEERKKGIFITAEKRPARKIEPVREKRFFLAVRLLGPFAVPHNLETTLQKLRLRRRFHAVLMEKNDSILGMLRTGKDYVTWGEVGSNDIAALLRERAVLVNGIPLTDKLVKERFGLESIEKLAEALVREQIALSTLWREGINPVFKLHPPSGGFQYSIKRPTGSRGELGYRPQGISPLVAHMM